MTPTRALNNPAAGQRDALRVLVGSATGALIAAAIAALWGAAAVFGVVAGALAIIAGIALAAWRSLPRTGGGAGEGLTRVAVGLVLKWMVIVVLLLLALQTLALPPMAVIAGVVAAELGYVAAFASIK